MKYPIIFVIWAVVALLIYITPQPAETKGPYCRVGLVGVGAVNFVASAEECARIHAAIERRLKHEANH